jgi:hypothetical protein
MVAFRAQSCRERVACLNSNALAFIAVSGLYTVLAAADAKSNGANSL